MEISREKSVHLTRTRRRSQTVGILHGRFSSRKNTAVINPSSDPSRGNGDGFGGEGSTSVKGLAAMWSSFKRSGIKKRLSNHSQAANTINDAVDAFILAGGTNGSSGGSGACVGHVDQSGDGATSSRSRSLPGRAHGRGDGSSEAETDSPSTSSDKSGGVCGYDSKIDQYERMPPPPVRRSSQTPAYDTLSLTKQRLPGPGSRPSLLATTGGGRSRSAHILNRRGGNDDHSASAIAAAVSGQVPAAARGGIKASSRSSARSQLALMPSRTAPALAGEGQEEGEGAMLGSHPSAADTAILRAVQDGDIPAAVEVKPRTVASRRREFSVQEVEKSFIRSLVNIDAGLGPDDQPLETCLLEPRRGHSDVTASPVGPRDSEAVYECDRRAAAEALRGPKKTLVLDLDETLVSSSRTPCDCDYKIVFKIHYREAPSDDTFSANADADTATPPKGRTAKEGSAANDGSEEEEEMIREIHYYVRLRPGLAKFLKKVAALYELVIWTASGKSYADAILDLLDPDGTLFSARLYRHACVRHRSLCVKDLRRLGRPMHEVLLLDNYVYSFGFTLDNGVPISPWTGNEEAKKSGLLMAYSLLRRVARAEDVRVPLITAFNLHQRIHGVRPPLSSVRKTPPPSAPLSSSDQPAAPPPVMTRQGTEQRVNGDVIGAEDDNSSSGATSSFRVSSAGRGVCGREREALQRRGRQEDKRIECLQE